MPAFNPFKQRQAAMDCQATFNTETGRRVLWNLLTLCHVFQPSYRPGAPAEATAFREGERNVGLQIMAMMNIRDMDKLQEYSEEAIV